MGMLSSLSRTVIAATEGAQKVGSAATVSAVGFADALASVAERCSEAADLALEGTRWDARIERESMRRNFKTRRAVMRRDCIQREQELVQQCKQDGWTDEQIAKLFED